MGRREDDFLDDSHADAHLRHLLEQFGEPRLLDPPPDLIARTLRRLPNHSPVTIAHATARQQWDQRALAGLLGAFVLLLALSQLWNMLGFGPALVSLFGNGSDGISRVLLTVQLLTKPLLGAISTASPQLLVTGLLLLFGSIGLWWWLVQRTPVYVVAEGQR